MAQVAIREYDAKNMFAKYTGILYSGILIKNAEDMEDFLSISQQDHFVIKPDQLFGKRGKHGLLGVNLDKEAIQKWWEEKNNNTIIINGQDGILDTFLIEPFVNHKSEYYVAIKTDRLTDRMYFSEVGGIDIEENWEHVQELEIPLTETTQNIRETITDTFHISTPAITQFLEKLYTFFVDYGFTYLEVNPFTLDSNGQIICLDMVARVDTCEGFKQKKHWQELEFANPFGAKKTPAEAYIEKLDAETGASLKFRILNPHGKIWLLTSGGGASVIIADTLADMGYTNEIGNYGECSGNPDRENTHAYTRTLLDAMLADGKTGKYLIIAGAIANFTHIDKTFTGIIDALQERVNDMKQQQVQILVRRGGIHDKKGLKIMQEACNAMGLSCEVRDGDSYMTDILSHIEIGKTIC